MSQANEIRQKSRKEKWKEQINDYITLYFRSNIFP